MPVKTHYREDLARQQLETAIRLFAVGGDFASVITLAGVADEVFDKFLSAQGKSNSLEELKKAVAAIHLKLYGEPDAPEHIARRANAAKKQLEALGRRRL